MTVQPIDKQRVGRVVLALLDGDEDKAAAVVDEALNDDRLLEYSDALLGALLGFMRLTYGLDATRQWANDWILKAHMDDQGSG
ncbi:MAG: hypothetical protein HYZ38_05055 [Mycobacterium sp.]|nr:hypothetical protein [Mycobacterium sp.]